MKNTSNPPKGKVSIKSAKRLLIVFAVIAALMTGLLFRTAWIQVIHGEDYSDIAKDQQTSDIPIEAKRGSIYDRNGEELATSATCYRYGLDRRRSEKITEKAKEPSLPTNLRS